MATNSFLDSNKKTKYGQHDVQFWIGTVVSYAAQKKQIEKGFGWMSELQLCDIIIKKRKYFFIILFLNFLEVSPLFA